MGLDYQYSFKILKKYNDLAEAGITNLKKKNEKKFVELIVKLKKRPPDGGIWTGPKVARWI